jgi:hypothetical protein
MNSLEAYMLSWQLADSEWVRRLAPLPDVTLDAIAKSKALAGTSPARVADSVLRDRQRALLALSQSIEKHLIRSDSK